MAELGFGALGGAGGSSERVKLGMGCDGRDAEALGVVGLSGSSIVGSWIVGGWIVGSGRGGGGIAALSRRFFSGGGGSFGAFDGAVALPLLTASSRILGAVSSSVSASSRRFSPDPAASAAAPQRPNHLNSMGDSHAGGRTMM